MIFRRLNVVLFLFLLMGAARALTPQEVSEVLGNPSGVTWQISGPNANAWTVSPEYLEVVSNVADETYSLTATVNGPGVLQVNVVLQGFTATARVDGIQDGDKLSEWESIQRVEVPQGEHSVEFRMLKHSYHSPSAKASFRLAVWEPLVKSPLGGAGAGVALSGNWTNQNRWHFGAGAAAWSGVVTALVPEKRLRAEFSGPGVLSHVVRSWGTGGSLEIDGEQAKLDVGDRWMRNYHLLEEGNHVAEWIPTLWPGYRWTSELAVDDLEILPEISPEVALDSPGRVWDLTLDSGRRAFGVPMDGTKGGAGMVIRDDAITSSVVGGELFRIRANSAYFMIECEGEPMYARGGSETEPDTEHGVWQTFFAEVPAAGGELRISATYDEVLIDFVELVEKPEDVETLLGLVGKGATVEGAWSVASDLDHGRYVALAELEPGKAAPWIEVPVMGPAKIRAEYSCLPGTSELEWLVNGRMVWSGAYSNSTRQEIHIEVPEGNHVVRVQGISPDSYDSVTVNVSEFEILPMPDGGLGGGAVWAYSGEWEKTVIEDVPAIRPVAGAKFGGEMPKLRRLIEGPGMLRTGVYLQKTEESGGWNSASWSLKDSVDRNEWFSMNDSDEDWSESVNWWYPPVSDDWVQWDLEYLSKFGITAIAFPEFQRWIKVPFSAAMNMPGFTWSMSDPLKPWTGGETF